MISDLTSQSDSNHPVILSFEKQCDIYKHSGLEALEEHINRLNEEIKVYRSTYIVKENSKEEQEYRNKMQSAELESLIAGAVLCHLKNDNRASQIYLGAAVGFQILIDFNNGYENPENS